MNTAFPEVMAGTTTSTVSPFLINAGLPYAANPNTHITSGVYLGDYYIRYNDNVTSGFESGYGSYNASTNELTVIKVYMSSTGDGVACDDFSSVAKHIGFTFSGSTLANMARVFASIPPHEDILIGASGQSNLGRLLTYQGAAPADNPNVLDWSRIADNTGAFDWRLVVKADEYTYPSAANDGNIFTGTMRSVLDGTWKECGSIIHSFACQLNVFTGRKVRTVVTYRGGTSLNDATNGWTYSPASSNCAKIFKDAVVAAIAALPADQASITKLHAYLFAQGENDASIDPPTVSAVNSDEYGHLLADHLRALEDTNRWNIADSNTLYVLMDIPDPMRGLKGSQVSGVKEFDGHAQAAALFGDRAIVIPTVGILTQKDGIHYWGEGGDTAGARAANILASTTQHEGSKGGTFRLSRKLTWPDVIWTREANSDTAPASAKWRLDADANVLQIHNDSSSGSQLANGLRNFVIGDILRFQKQSDSTRWMDIRIDGNVDTATANVTKYPASVVTESGTPITTTEICLLSPQTTGFHDGKSYVSSTPHFILSGRQSLANTETAYSGGAALTTFADYAKNFHTLMADKDGQFARSRKLATRGAFKRTPSNASTVLFQTNHFEDGRVEHIRARVLYKNTANNNIGLFILEGIIRRTGVAASGNTTFDWLKATEEVMDEEALGTNPVFTAVSIFGIEGYTITVVGKLNVPLDWACEVETIELPTSA